MISLLTICSILLMFDGFANIIYWKDHKHEKRWHKIAFQSERALRGFTGLFLPYLMTILTIVQLQFAGFLLVLEGIINIYLWRGDKKLNQAGRITRTLGGLFFMYALQVGMPL